MQSRTPLVATMIACALSSFVAVPAHAEKPTVVLIGDSIRLGYAPVVRQHLSDRADVISSPANGGDSSSVLRSLSGLAIKHHPAVVHFNCGIHDSIKDKTSGRFRVPPEQYEKNLREIVGTLRRETKAVILFALTTPIRDGLAANHRADRSYELLDASIEQYNAIAKRVMKEFDVPINDLRAVLGDENELAKLITADGVHMTAEANDRLGVAVAEFVSRHLPNECGVK